MYDCIRRDMGTFDTTLDLGGRRHISTSLLMVFPAYLTEQKQGSVGRNFDWQSALVICVK